MKDAETQLEHFALELFNWHLANNPKIHDLCLHAQEMAIALGATVKESLTVDHIEKGLKMVSEISELLPCPFCGAQPELVHDYDHEAAWFSLGCSSNECGAKYFLFGQAIGTENSAISAWNTRHPVVPANVLLQITDDEGGLQS